MPSPVRSTVRHPPSVTGHGDGEDGLDGFGLHFLEYCFAREKVAPDVLRDVAFTVAVDEPEHNLQCGGVVIGLGLGLGCGWGAVRYGTVRYGGSGGGGTRRGAARRGEVKYDVF